MDNKFSVSQSINFGWQTFKTNYKFWLIASIIGVYSNSLAFGGLFDANDQFKQLDQPSNQSTQISQQDSLDKIDNTQQPSIQQSDIPTETPQTQAEAQVLSPTSENISNATTATTNPQTTLIARVITMIILLPYVITFFIVSIFAYIVLTTLYLGYTKLLLDAANKNDLRYQTLLSIVDLKKSTKYIIASILYLLLVIFGLILFVIPGVYFGVKYMFFSFAIVDKNLGIKDSFKYSAKITKGSRLKLTGFGILGLALTIAGFMMFMIGGYIATIILSLSSAYIYKKLQD